MKKKVLILVVVILLILLTIFTIDAIRKFIILEQYSEAVASRMNCTNYYVKFVNNKGKNDEMTIEMFRKGNIKIYRHTSPNGPIRTMYQEDENDIIILTETLSGEKSGFKTNSNIMPGYNGGDSYFSSIYEAGNWLNKFKLILDTKITTEKINGKECYRLYINDNLQVYVNKEDMVVIQDINGSSNFEYEKYSFDTVTDQSIKMPILEEYGIM